MDKLSTSKDQDQVGFAKKMMNQGQVLTLKVICKIVFNRLSKQQFSGRSQNSNLYLYL